MAERIALDEMIQYIYTKKDIKEMLSSLGISKGMVVLVQPDMQKLGFLVGGAQILIEALMEQVGYEGALVIPTFTLYLADPANREISIARDQWQLLREYALPFDRKLSMPQEKNTFAQQFLLNEGVIRSYHPLYSFAAWGKYAKLICDKHPLHFGLNQDSPLGKVVDFNGYVLLLGTDYQECLMFRLARYHGEQLPIKIVSAPMEINKKRIWKDMLDLDHDQQDVKDIGEAMEDRYIVKTAMLNQGLCRFFSAREAQALATTYFHIHND